MNVCNFNGIPDALDIEQRRSQDRNFNALPEECEDFVSVPMTSSVAPTNPPPFAPFQVQLAFKEAFP